MTDEVRIPISVLRAAVEVVLTGISEGCEEVAIPAEHYWSVSKEEIFDLSKAPEALTVGELSDVVANLRMLSEDAGTLSSWSAVWLGDLLRAIGMTPRED